MDLYPYPFRFVHESKLVPNKQTRSTPLPLFNLTLRRKELVSEKFITSYFPLVLVSINSNYTRLSDNICYFHLVQFTRHFVPLSRTL